MSTTCGESTSGKSSYFEYQSRRTLNTKVVGFVGMVPGDSTKVWERNIWTMGE
jgi:hypothetical protein